MARLVFSMLMASVMVAPGARVPSQTPTIGWENIAVSYKTFSEIKPILDNNGSQPIFLSRIWPHGYAQLERYRESTGQWEPGSWSGGCGTVAHAMDPIEIRAHSKRKVQVYWQLSTDDWDHPQHFVVENLEKRPLRGKYRFILRYALQPWTLVDHPDRVFTLESPEFVVGQ